MGSPIDRTAKTALDSNLVNGVTSDAPKVKANNDVLYNYSDTLNSALDTHAAAATLPHADSSVTGPKIRDGAVTTAKIADLAVTQAKIANGAVGVNQLATGLAVSADVNAMFAKRAIDVTSAPYNAIGDGVTDDTAAIQAAINAASGKEVYLPYSYTFAVSSQLIVSNPMVLNIEGTIKPTTTGTSETPLIKITSSNVHVIGNGLGMIDGNNKKWCGIQAVSTVVIENVTVSGMRFENIAVNDTLAFAISFASVKDGRILENKLKNVGVIGNVGGGGFGIYLQHNQGTIVKSNTLNTVGSTGINVSAGIGNIVENNVLRNITLFGLKGGYGITDAVSNNVTPTTTTFSIPKNANTVMIWFVGTAFLVFSNNNTYAEMSVVKSIADNGTYYTITCSPLASAPTVGFNLEIPDSGTKWLGNDLMYTGDNGMDINITHAVTIKGNRILYSGWYQAVGVFAGLRAGIWIGADPQGSINYVISSGVVIEGNTIEHTAGSAIEIFQTDNILINGNLCRDYNEYNETVGIANPSYGGIEVGRLQTNRMRNIKITDNIVKSANGYGIYAGFFINGSITGNVVQSATGIKVNSAVAAQVSDNIIEASVASAYGLLLSNDGGGGNINDTIQINTNSIRTDSTSGTFGINITDTGANLVTITDDNYIAGAATIIATSSTKAIGRYQYVTPFATQVKSNLRQEAEGHFVGLAATSGSVTFGSFQADNGTAGMMIIEGIARRNTNDAEAFRLVVWGGYLATNAVAYTSLGVAKGSAFLAGANFTATVDTDNLTVNVGYTNPSATQQVFFSCKVTSVSRH